MNIPALSTMDTLFAVYQDHKRDLPEPVSVHLNARYATYPIQVHIGEHGDPAAAVRQMLAWAQSLDTVVVEWWHTDSGNLHITIEGGTADGTRMQVYGAVPYDRCSGIAQLDSGERIGVPVNKLRELAGHLAEVTR